MKGMNRSSEWVKEHLSKFQKREKQIMSLGITKFVKKTVNLPSEHEEQEILINWCDVMTYTYPEFKLIYAIPNGGDRNPVVAAKLKAEGVKPGVPDLCLPVPRGEYHGLYIEMKRQDGGSGTSENQDWWIVELRKQGYYVKVCNGFDEASKLILEYLSLVRKS